MRGMDVELLLPLGHSLSLVRSKKWIGSSPLRPCLITRPPSEQQPWTRSSGHVPHPGGNEPSGRSEKKKPDRSSRYLPTIARRCSVYPKLILSSCGFVILLLLLIIRAHRVAQLIKDAR